MKKAVFGLEPLGCPSCVKKIENTIGKMDGVKEVKVLFNSNKVRAQFDEDIVQAEQDSRSHYETRLSSCIAKSFITNMKGGKYHERKTHISNYRGDRYSSCHCS